MSVPTRTHAPWSGGRRPAWLPLALVAVLLLSACGRNMADGPRLEAFEATPFFADGAAMQPLPEGTISRDRGGIDPVYFTGQGDDGLVAELPIELTGDLLRRGQERYNIFCSPCHDYDGRGTGMVVQNGFPQPSSFQVQRLLDAPVGYYYNVVTNGFGRMYPYDSRIPVEDRWAIAAYVKALQLSQNATVDDVPADILEELRAREGAVR